MNIIQRCEKAKNEFYLRTLRLPNTIALGKAEIKEIEDYVYAENKDKELKEQEYARKYKHAYIQPVLHDPNKVFHEECNKHYYLQLDKQSDNAYLASYQVFDSYPDDTYYEFDFLQECGDTNPANAACKLLIWLIKEGLFNGQ